MIIIIILIELKKLFADKINGAQKSRYSIIISMK